MSYIEYANQGATRNQSLSPQLTQALGFLPDLGVTARVFSGGQPSTGSNRVGSTRHDHGDAADVLFFQGGRQLDYNNPEDVPIYQQIVSRGRAAGLTGFGAGENYMTPGSMHIGFGTPAVWGEDGRGANAPRWLRDAYQGAPAGQAPTNTQTTGFGMDDTPQQPSGDLSRSQRMMLGFAALRDAGAALQGQNSNFFADTMGGFQQQAQAADDRAFRQMQFDEGVRQFGVQQAGATAQRGLLTAQERRLLDERNQQTRMTALQGIAALDAQDEQARAVAAASGRPYTPSAASVAMRQAFMGQLTSAGGTLGDPAAGTPAGVTPTGVPATGVTPTGVPAAGVPEAGTPTGVPATAAPSPQDVQTALEIVRGDLGAPQDVRAAYEVLQGVDPAVSNEAFGFEVGDLPDLNDRIEAAQQQQARATSAMSAAGQVQRILEDPAALARVLGPVRGAIDPEGNAAVGLLTGEDQAMISLINQVGGAAFKDAFESLKGGGQITETEGRAATRALSRLDNRRQDPQSYMAAAEEVMKYFLNAAARAEGRPDPHPTDPETGLFMGQGAGSDRSDEELLDLYGGGQ